ncbi:DUF58 domain-containing protein [Sporosarcina ureilytica]|uniref:DUF58 domain-containing protein n=1 Tax=Sporosarcina ureilytica TaxID=298596 RepID=A0A1D8JDH3_9BACL|nr:DUF58 domain-containing protein [Sporosarcina ureilytica]AOV06751.1 hypothetical protein BI350_03520 [Sporosarcina ureilytica]
MKLRKSVASLGRLLFVLLILVSAFVFAMFQGGLVSWTIFYAILPFIIYSILLFLYPLSNFKAKRQLEVTHLQNGEKLRVKIRIKRSFPFPLLYTVLGDEWIDEGKKKTIEQLNKVLVFGWKRELEWEYKIDEMPRGEHVARHIQVEVTDFFGWVRKNRLIATKNTVLVYPRMMDVAYMPIESKYNGGLATSPFNIVKDTTMVTGVRDYQFGDRVSWIHWKSFARTQTLMTKEFDDRSSQDVLLVFDNRASNTFEEQVEFTASIMQEAIKDRSTIRFLPVGLSEPFSAMHSEEQFRLVLTYLAKIQPVKIESIVPSTEFKKEIDMGGNIVIITARPTWDFLEAMISNVTGKSTIICFVVMKNKASLKGNLVEEIKYARSKGIIVHPIVKQQFSKAFREVARP